MYDKWDELLSVNERKNETEKKENKQINENGEQWINIIG